MYLFDDSGGQGLLFGARDDVDASPVIARDDLPYVGSTTIVVLSSLLSVSPGPSVTVELANHSDRRLTYEGTYFHCGDLGTDHPATNLEAQWRLAYSLVQRPDQTDFGVSAVSLFRIRTGLQLAVFAYNPLTHHGVYAAWLTQDAKANADFYDLCWRRCYRGENIKSLASNRLGFVLQTEIRSSAHATFAVRLLQD